MKRQMTLIRTLAKLVLVLLLASLAVQVTGGVGQAATGNPGLFPQQAAPALPLVCSNTVSQKYCDIRVVLLIDDTGSMRSNDPTAMRDQGAKNLVDILDQEYYQPALDAQANDPSVILPDIKVAVIHFSHCTSSEPSDHCSQDVKFNSGWLPITQKENLYTAIDWLKTQPNFYHVKQYTHFTGPFQAAVDLFNQPEAGIKNDCVHRLAMLLTDGTPEDIAGPLNEPDLGNEMGQVKNILKGFLSQPQNSVYVTAFKILPRYWSNTEPYWNDIAGSPNVSLESSLDEVASRMEKITASVIGARTSTLSPDPNNSRLYKVILPHHVSSLRITYYKLDPNASLTLADPQGNQVIPDGKTVTQTGQDTSIEVWMLTDPSAGAYQIKTSARGGIITTTPLYAINIQLDAPSPDKPLLRFTNGEIQFKLLDGQNQPVLPADDPAFKLNVQASLMTPAGQSTPLSLTQKGDDFQAAWMPLTADKAVVHVSVGLTDANNNSLWKCEGDGGDLPVESVGVQVELPSACTAVNASALVPLQLINPQTGQNTGIDLPIQWQASSLTVPGGQQVDTSVNEVDAKMGTYRLTIKPVLPEDVQTHVTASVVADGSPIEFYSKDITTTVCPVVPPGPSCTCSGYWNYLFWMLLVLLIVFLLTRLLFRKKDRKYSLPFWAVLILLILLILIWWFLCCKVTFWPLLILLLILLVILLLIVVISRRDGKKFTYRLWLLIILLLILLLIWFILFSETWLYLFWMLLILLVALIVIWFSSQTKNEEEPFQVWILWFLLIVLVSTWLIFFGKFASWLILILLLFWLIILLLMRFVSQENNWRSSYQFWSLVFLLLILMLAWLIFFGAYWIYLFWLWIVLLLVWLALWLVCRYRNPLWGVISIVDQKNRVLWSAPLARSDKSGGKSCYNWRFKDPVGTVKRLNIHSWDQRHHWLVLVVTLTTGKQYFRRNLDKWQDCELDASYRIVWYEKAPESKPRKLPKPKSGRDGKSHLKSYGIEKIEGIGSVYAARLEQFGIHTTSELLKVAGSRKGRKKLAEDAGLSIRLILKWVNRADLMRVPGIGEEYSDLLEVGGVDTVRELRRRNPENLFNALRKVNEKKHLVRRIPTLEEVQAWVASAAKMKALVEY